MYTLAECAVPEIHDKKPAFQKEITIFLWYNQSIIFSQSEPYGKQGIL
jgi:hypothetical protein